MFWQFFLQFFDSDKDGFKQKTRETRHGHVCCFPKKHNFVACINYQPWAARQDFLTNYDVQDKLIVMCRCLLSVTLVFACPLNMFPAVQALFNVSCTLLITSLFFVSLRYDFEDVFHMIENLETRQLVESGGSWACYFTQAGSSLISTTVLMLSKGSSEASKFVILQLPIHNFRWLCNGSTGKRIISTDDMDQREDHRY